MVNQSRSQPASVLDTGNRSAKSSIHGPVKWAATLVEGLSLLFIAAILYGFFTAAPQTKPINDLADLTMSAPSKISGSDTDNNSAVFRTFDPFFRSYSAVAVQQARAPESTMNIKIYGVRYGQSSSTTAPKAQHIGQQGSVILKVQGQDQKLARIGDVITPGVRLTAIYQDRIEVTRSGKRESITYNDRPKSRPMSLPDTTVTDKAGQTVATTATTATTTGQRSQSTRSLPAQNTPRKASIDPYTKELVEALNLQPFRRSGRITGFQIGSKANSLLLLPVGLRKQDIILAVNGEKLTSFERLEELPAQLSAQLSGQGSGASPIQLDIERRGEKSSVSVPVAILKTLSTTGQTS